MKSGLNKFLRHNALARRGFTLVEMLTVVVIIILLLGIFVPTVTRARQNIMRNQSLSTIRVLDAGIQNFKTELGEYPDSSGGAVQAAKWNMGAGTGGNQILVEALTGYMAGTSDGKDGLGLRKWDKDLSEWSTKVYGPYAETVPTDKAAKPSFVDSFKNTIYYYNYRGSYNPADNTDPNAASDAQMKLLVGQAATYRQDFILLSAGPSGKFDSSSTTDAITNYLPE